MVKILLVEDNQYKRDKILSVLNSISGDVEIDNSESFSTAAQRLEKLKYDLVILDMSLPTYDKSKYETGGQFRPFGGKELASKIRRKRIESKIIFITQYDSFVKDGVTYSFKELSGEILTEYDSMCLGFIYYDSTSTKWRQDLIDLIASEYIK